MTATASPFVFTYTPAAGDEGNIVTITVTTDNPLGDPCAAATATYTLTVNAIPAAPVPGTITQPTCLVSTGSVILNGLPASGTWTINPGMITGTGTSTTISGLTTGTYSFTVANSAGCTSPSSENVVIISIPGAPAAPDLGTIAQPTCETPTGSVILNNLPAGNWTINPGAITGTGMSTTISGLSAGTYNFTVTDEAGCTSAPSSNVIINDQPLAPPLPTITLTQPSCSLATGTITVTAPSEAGMTYSIDGSTYTNSTGIFTLLVPNTYNVTARNAAGCISTGINVTINSQPLTPSVPELTVIQPTCSTATGTITVAVQNAGETYSFDNGATFQAGNSRTGITPGTYNVIIKSTGGCNSVATSATIDPQPTSPASPSQTIDCSLGSGNAAVTVTSPTGAGLEYSIDGGLYQAGTTFINVPNGSHIITVRNSSGCIQWEAASQCHAAAQTHLHLLLAASVEPFAELIR